MWRAGAATIKPSGEKYGLPDFLVRDQGGRVVRVVSWPAWRLATASGRLISGPLVLRRRQLEELPV